MKRLLGTLTAAACLALAGHAYAACSGAAPPSTPASSKTLLGAVPADQAVISGGCIDNTPIGQNTPAAVNATTLKVTGTTAAFGNAAGAPTHIITQQATAPALTSCGTSPSITGTDEAGIVTMGTSATGCVITFNVAYSSAPFCIVTWIATPLASQSYVTAADKITLSQTSADNNVVQYMCRARAG